MPYPVRPCKDKVGDVLKFVGDYIMDGREKAVVTRVNKLLSCQYSVECIYLNGYYGHWYNFNLDHISEVI